MSNRIISKDKLPQFERWEWNAIGQTQSQQKVRTPQGDIPVQTRALDLEALQQTALEEARAEGLAQGQQQIHQQARQLQQLMQAAQQEWHVCHRDMAEHVLTLAIDLARHIVRHELRTHPEQILPVVREAMDALTTLGHHPQLIVNPEDAALIRAHLEDELKQEGWKLIENPRIARGGCKVNSSAGEVDATLPTRWQRVMAGLDEASTWEGTPVAETSVNGTTNADHSTAEPSASTPSE